MARTDPTPDFDAKLKELTEFVGSIPYLKKEVGYVLPHQYYGNDVIAKAKEMFEADGWQFQHQYSDEHASYDYLWLKRPKPKKEKKKKESNLPDEVNP